MTAGIPYEEAHKRYRPGVRPPVRSDDGTVEALPAELPALPRPAPIY